MSTKFITCIMLLALVSMIIPSVGAQEGTPLIGELEGPTVITDPAQYPTSFSEAPMLAEQVAAGALPPVEERLPAASDVLVIQPLDEIGTYGGTLQRAFTGPGDHWNGKRLAGLDHILYLDHAANEVIPNVAKGWELSEDGTELTLYLREGMKWSDGHPFTADDFMFYFEDMELNEEIGPVSEYLIVNGEVAQVEKIDDYTVKYAFAGPYFMFPNILAGFANIASHSTWGFSARGGFAPAHYLKQFHPAYASEDELNAAIEEAGVENWVQLISLKNDWSINPDLPVLTHWMTTNPINTDTWVLERNPYFFAVDTAGNQLPYIDQVVMTLAEDNEVLNLRAVAGDYDFQARHLQMSNLPVFIENRAQGGYNIYLDPGDNVALVVRFNLTYQEDAEIARLLSDANFRRALSMGIDRDQFNEAFYLGLGGAGSAVPADTNAFYPGDEWRTMWAELDPDTANQMLDDLGLVERDGDGFRQRSDGDGRLTLSLVAISGSFQPYEEIAEMMRQQWADNLGIDVRVDVLERSLAAERAGANEVHLTLWDGGGTDNLFGQPSNLFPNEEASSMGPLWGLWFMSNGEQGEEPEEGMKFIMDAWKQGQQVPYDERVALGKEMWQTIVDNVYYIGVIGQVPATMGLRIADTNLGNIPARQVISLDGMTPGLSRPDTFYWK